MSEDLQAELDRLASARGYRMVEDVLTGGRGLARDCENILVFQGVSAGARNSSIWWLRND